MAIEDVLKETLETVAGLSGQVYPLNAPEDNPAPYLTYLQSSGEEYDALDDWTGLYKGSYELNVLHRSYKEMKQLAALVIAKLKTLQGTTISEILVQSVSIDENSPELYETQIKLYRKIINITIQY
ncbi:MAG: DUF3168 domain-containing protein [Eubacteriales bacterium]